MRLLLCVIAGATLVGCGGPTLFKAVPVSVLPGIDGVSVVGSEAVEGNSCCEPNPGKGRVWLTVTGGADRDPVITVADGLLTAGWESEPCMVAASGPATVLPDLAAAPDVCVRTSGLSARITERGPGMSARQADVYVWLVRTTGT